MCGLFGTHKGHKIGTAAELKKINEDLAEDGKDFLKAAVDFAQLKASHSYAELLQTKAKEKVKTCKSVAMRVYEVS